MLAGVPASPPFPCPTWDEQLSLLQHLSSRSSGHSLQGIRVNHLSTENLQNPESNIHFLPVSRFPPATCYSNRKETNILSNTHTPRPKEPKATPPKEESVTPVWPPLICDITNFLVSGSDGNISFPWIWNLSAFWLKLHRQLLPKSLACCLFCQRTLTKTGTNIPFMWNINSHY
jgi:hypothetical protein